MKRKISTKSTMATNNHNIETKGCTTMKRKLISILLTLVLCIGMLPSTVTTAYAASAFKTSTSSTTYYYVLKNVKSNKYLNVKGNSSSNNANITIYSKDSSSGQNFCFSYDSSNKGYVIVPECATSRAVNIYGSSATAGKNICTWTKTGHSTQAWVIESVSGGYIIRSSNNKNYVLAASGTSNGSNVCIQKYKSGDKSQIWTISLSKTVSSSSSSATSTSNTSSTSISNSISLSSSSVSVKAGQSKTITASFTGSGLKNFGTGSTDDSVASVYISSNSYNSSTGKGTANITVTAKSAGTTTITFATYNSSKMVCYKQFTVTVTADTGTGIQGDGLYTISPACAPSCKLDVSGGSSNNKANLQIYTSNNTTSQQFYLTSMGNGYYIMTAKVSGKVVTTASSKSGANAYQYEYNRDNKEYWLIKSAGDGYYYIYSGADTSKALDVNGASSTSGTNVQLYTANNSNAQKWAFNRVSSSTSGSTVSSVTSTTNKSTAATFKVKTTSTTSPSYVTIDILNTALLSSRYTLTSSGKVNVKIVASNGKVLVNKTCSSKSNKITVPKGYSSYTVYVTKYTWSGNNLITSSIAGGNNFTNLGNYCQISLSNAKLT